MHSFRIKLEQATTKAEDDMPGCYVLVAMIKIKAQTESFTIRRVNNCLVRANDIRSEAKRKLSQW